MIDHPLPTISHMTSYPMSISSTLSTTLISPSISNSYYQLDLLNSNTTIPSLLKICIEKVINILEYTNFHPQQINELCKILSNCQHILDPILELLLQKKVMTDVGLIAFLVPERLQLVCPELSCIKNSTFKMVGYNCPNLTLLNLSDCHQISNSVVRCILQGCPNLQELVLNRCRRITDAAFDPLSSPFEVLHGCLSLKSISLQGCNQITGYLASVFVKMCHNLKTLNLSQCKRISSPDLKHIFSHPLLQSINLLFADLISDETFSLLPVVALPMNDSNIPLSKHDRHSPYLALLFGESSSLPLFSDSIRVSTSSSCTLTSLSIGMSSITDITLYRIASFASSLIELHLQWCSNISDTGIDVLVSYCRNLRILNLKSCSQLTDQSLKSIGKECFMLTHLDISWCSELTDDGVLHLISEENKVSLPLSHLNLSWCPLITSISLFVIFRQVLHLSWIDLSGCAGVTSDCVSKLQQCRTEVCVNS